MWELRCGEVIPDCDGVVRAETREEVMSQAAVHAADVHGLTTIDPETRQVLADAIHWD
jgi:predicted small metal-binding protein